MTTDIEMTNLQALGFTKSVNRLEKIVATSGKAGKVLPLAFVPLLRGDQLNTTRMSFTFKMAETAKPLFNPVHLDVRAYFIPHLASERFNGPDQLDRAYMGVPDEAEGPVRPFVEKVLFSRYSPFWKTLGEHAKHSSQVNGFSLEAFNLLVNWRRKMRSRILPQLGRYDAKDNTMELPTCFWPHNSLSHIVADYDDAMIEGAFELDLLSQTIPVQGIGLATVQNFSTLQSFKTSDGRLVTGADNEKWTVATENSTDYNPAIAADANGYPQVLVDLQNAGITASLSNLDAARKTRAFAEVRKKYASHIQDEEAGGDYIIDMLMSGIEVPAQHLAQPILLDRKQTIFGQSTRYATDSGNLEKSVTQGMSIVDLRMAMPKTNVGGIILITAEICPAQINERILSPYLDAHTTVGKDLFPDALRDTLDVDKVDVVRNSHIDAMHTDPDGVFGYAPLHHRWRTTRANVGGKWYRPIPDAAFDEDRLSIWSVEEPDPVLSENFYLANDLHSKVFQYENMDHFEISGRGVFPIVGLTQFGKGLHESSDDYEKMSAVADLGSAKDEV